MDPVVLVFAGFAAFIIFRLISTLGARTGHEQRTDVEGVQRSVRAREADAETAIEEPEQPLRPVTPAAAPLREADPAFDEQGFLQGAGSAYEMIVEAFAAGDLKSIRRYLSQSVYDAFKAGVAAREELGQRYELKFVGLDKASIVSSEVESGVMTAVVDFWSNQVRVTRDSAGETVDGDPTRIDLVKDRWTFSRKVASRDPNWELVATGAGA